MVDKLKAASTIAKGAGYYYSGVSARDAGRSTSSQYKANARDRLIRGQREAAGYRKQGRTAVSNATVAMIAQGGVVDSEMLAKIKGASDIDAISAMYDAKADAVTMEHAARTAKIQGKHQYRQDVLRAGSTVLSGASSFMSPSATKSPYAGYSKAQRTAGRKFGRGR